MPPGRAPLLIGALLVLLSGAGQIWALSRHGLLEPPSWLDLMALGGMVLGWILVAVGVIGTVRGTIAREKVIRDDEG